MNEISHLEPDLGIAAFLVTRGFHLLGLVPNAGRFLFRFADPTEVQPAIDDYRQGALVCAKTLLAAEKDLKAQLYSVKGKNHRYGNGTNSDLNLTPR